MNFTTSSNPARMVYSPMVEENAGNDIMHKGKNFGSIFVRVELQHQTYL